MGTISIFWPVEWAIGMPTDDAQTSYRIASPLAVGVHETAIVEQLTAVSIGNPEIGSGVVVSVTVT
jgi:hypothetical protein